MINEEQYDSDILYFRSKIEKRMRSGALTSDDIRDIVKKSKIGEDYSDSILGEMVKHLESIYCIRHSAGTIIYDKSSKHQPWLKELMKTQEFIPYYWDGLRKYLRKKGFPLSVMTTLDEDSDKILDYAGSPLKKEAELRHGMVIGHVQSGKTTNYSALICKAADAGYKCIIVLSGTSDMLRDQTQQRIDEAFIGTSTYEQGKRKKVGVGFYRKGKRAPIHGTSMANDFSEKVSRFGFHSGHINNEPIVFVIKKNTKILQNLNNWLRADCPEEGIDSPLLLIDDEADNASINTKRNPGEVTRTNKEIREILSLFRRASYIGYTATPFANIFIEPDSDDGMQNEDLFPHNFIMTLNAPDNYVGADKIFSDDDYSEKTVGEINDYDQNLPKYKAGDDVKNLPESLKRAVRLFILCRVLMKLENKEEGHATMMVNVSHYTAVQEKIKGLIYDYLQKIISAIRMNSDSNRHIVALREDFEDEYKENGVSWKSVCQHLRSAVDIRVCTVNTNSEKLNYADQEKQRIIVVGGFALSRGFTLEGLRVSYLIRNPGAYDTLMQMGRWFGYRESYKNRCRIFMPKALVERYAFVNKATEELRDEIRAMNSLDLTPKDFGLKIRRHPASAFGITARNKMRHATTRKFAIGFALKEVQTEVIHGDKEINKKNYEYISEWIKKLGTPSGEEQDHPLFWRGVPYRDVLDFMRGFRLPLKGNRNLTINGTPASPTRIVNEYIEERCGELPQWDVCVPLLKNKDGNNSFLGKKASFRGRNKGEFLPNENLYRIRELGKRIADPGDCSIGLSSEQIARTKEEQGVNSTRASGFNQNREFPLLIVHLFNARINAGKEKKEKPLFFGEKVPAVAYSIYFPSSEIPAEEKDYALNSVYQALMLDPSWFDSEPEYDDDE